MRRWSIGVVVALAACSSNDRTGPGAPLEIPATLTSITLDGAIALSWSDNAFTSDPGNFQNYRVYSTSYNLNQNLCGSTFQLEGSTVAPEFLVGALTNGISRCFSVTAVSVDGFESDRSPLRFDTPRPDARTVVINVFQSQAAGSGFRFWDDLNGDGLVGTDEIGLVRAGNALDIDFVVDRDPGGDVFLTPIRPGTGVEYYDDTKPVEDLTAIDFAANRTYRNSGIQALPGFGYVFEMHEGDGFIHYGALRILHVGQTFLIVDWAYQTDPLNPELEVSRK